MVGGSGRRLCSAVVFGGCGRWLDVVIVVVVALKSLVAVAGRAGSRQYRAQISSG